MEQLICAAGRAFVATEHSTFSGFIPRLRGYMGAPDTQIYFNTYRYFGPSDDHAEIEGQNYMREFPALWEEVPEKE